MIKYDVIIYEGKPSLFLERIDSLINKSFNTVTMREIVTVLDGKNQNEEEVQELFNNKNFVIYNSDFVTISDSFLINLPNFLHNITEIYNIDIFVCNPPKVIREEIYNYFDDEQIHLVREEFSELTKYDISGVYKTLKKSIKGQEEILENIITNLYPLNNNKPLVFLFYGSSGVGKTETVKILSDAIYEKKPLNIQFSMMQTEEGINYFFGRSNSSSFSYDLKNRETNIILFDEFDKSNPLLYNSLYQMFDEGFYEDTKYNVELKNSIIICTSNFKDKNQIINALGYPIYYRFDLVIGFNDLSTHHLEDIILEKYQFIYNNLNSEEKDLLDNYDTRTKLKKLSHHFKNPRQIEKKLRYLIKKILVSEYL